MNYKRRNYRRRSNPGFGSIVGESAGIANMLCPRGALVTGLVGFVLLYFVVPTLLTAWLEHNQAKMSTGPSGQVMRGVMENLFSKRFIRPSELAGIAILIIGMGISAWKLMTDNSLSRSSERDSSFFARLLGRFLV